MNQGPPDPHTPESQPTRQGRRLIRMLFRSGGEDVKTVSGDRDSRAEDAAWKQPSNHQENGDKQAPAPTSKFASLKRKLFPSQNRRHPRQVPPLLISPINAPTKALLPPLADKTKSLRHTPTPMDDEARSEHNHRSACSSRERLKSERPELEAQEENLESDSFVHESDNNWRATGRRTLFDDDDDRDLESAVEALDLESSIADKTLEEMNKAIDDLRVWKEAQERATQETLSKMQSERDHQLPCAEPPNYDDQTFGMELELKRQQQQDREAQGLALRKEAEAYQLECSLFKTLDVTEATRVELALQSSGDSSGLALSRLRDELFQLDVKQRQDALLLELQGADGDLDMNPIDVQAFTGELDAILAQFAAG